MMSSYFVSAQNPPQPLLQATGHFSRNSLNCSCGLSKVSAPIESKSSGLLSSAIATRFPNAGAHYASACIA